MAEPLGPFLGSLIDALVSSGVRHACIAPGSRSTPLALLLQRHPGIRVWMHLDERSAAFFALGMARACEEPVALLSTSGTAAANFYPAVIEAQLAQVPLIVLTADRPPELQDVGAPQTIDQHGLYGSHVKWFAHLPLPEDTPAALGYARTTAVRAVSTASIAPAGPVHLNVPIREPLLPGVTPTWMPPTPTVSPGRLCPAQELIRALGADLAGVERGLIVCGPQPDRALAPAVHRLGARLGYPILADPLSQVRTQSEAGAWVSSHYDAYLRDESAATLAPEVIIRFGANPTSKPLFQYQQRHPCRQILVDPAGWHDPFNTATDIVRSEPVIFADTLWSHLSPPSRSGTWLEHWKRMEEAAWRAMREAMTEMDTPFEGQIFTVLADLLDPGATLFVGSSMPVRDLDTFFPARPGIRFMSNRGANGIDGVVSSALGAATQGPLVLVLGDLSFYHDLNGLLAAKLHGIEITIVLINNDGGGIFSFLPQAGVPGFETLFGTPHGLDFAPAVQMYGGSFERVSDKNEITPALARALAGSGLRVVEVVTERERNVAQHRLVWQRVAAALAGEMTSV